jgi:hypothetical protein
MAPTPSKLPTTTTTAADDVSGGEDDNNNTFEMADWNDNPTKKAKIAASWKCNDCLNMNAEDESSCLRCGKRKAVNTYASTGGWGDLFGKEDHKDNNKGSSSSGAISAAPAPAIVAAPASIATQAPGESSSSSSSGAISISVGGLSFSLEVVATPAPPGSNNIGAGPFGSGFVVSLAVAPASPAPPAPPSTTSKG